MDNLIRIKKTNNNNSGLIIATCNTQAIKTNELQVSELLSDYSINALIVTETWLNSKDNIWVDTTDLNRNPYKMYIQNRQSEHRGGGIALICKKQYPVTLKDSGHTHSFEYATWQINVKNKAITLTGIYHPPYSLKNKTTNMMFLDEFITFATELLPKNPNNIFMGDFNLHVSVEGDTDSAIFCDSTEAMDLYQHVQFETHKAGNKLNLILSEIESSMTINTTSLGPYISDHRAVICSLSIKKTIPKSIQKEVHKTRNITEDQWLEEFDPNKVPLSNKLDELVASLNQELVHTLDTLALVKKCQKELKPKKPWYTTELKQLKRKVRKHEHKWLKYKLDSGWCAYKAVRNSYYAILNNNKKEALKCKIADCNNDHKKLHKLINNLTN